MCSHRTVLLKLPFHCFPLGSVWGLQKPQLSCSPWCLQDLAHRKCTRSAYLFTQWIDEKYLFPPPVLSSFSLLGSLPAGATAARPPSSDTAYLVYQSMRVCSQGPFLWGSHSSGCFCDRSEIWGTEDESWALKALCLLSLLLHISASSIE